MSNRNAATRAPSNEVQNAEAAEASYLNPATASIHEAASRVEEQNERLQRLIARRQALAQRLHASLSEARAERRSIEKEMKDILRPAPPHGRTSSTEATR